MLEKLCCVQTQCKILAERSFLKTLGGGCSAPVAVITNLISKSGIDIKDDQKPFTLDMKGAVWSLDGAVEVVGDSECILDFNKSYNNNDGNEIIPSKRTKYSKSEDYPKSDQKVVKPPSPTVVDETPSCSTSAASEFDIEKLMNIHGDLFKKCPYAVHHQAAQDADKCPLSMPVGQDVMGQCPYFDTNQKAVANEFPHAVKCPIGEPTENNNDSINSTNDNEIRSCPFILAASKQNESVSITAEHRGSIANKRPAPVVEDDIQLYCGLYRHKNQRQDLFENCETLGKKLAEYLISKGAQKVMEKAQLEIRQKI